MPKVQDGIRVVYDTTKCLLDDIVWAPNFFLPSVDTVPQCIESTTVCGDIDIGEMLSNYTLSKKLQQYTGVDVTDMVIGPKHENYSSQWYCGRCYVVDPKYEFYTAVPENGEGIHLPKRKENIQFMERVDRAHLIQSFQCDLCWFCSLKLRSPRHNI